MAESARDRIKNKLKQYQNSSADWFSLKDDGDSAMVRFLVGDDSDLEDLIIPVHEVEGPNGKKVKVRCAETSTCPLCNSGNRASLKLFLYLVHDSKVKVWERGQSFIGKVLTMIDEYGPLNNRVYKVVRNGKKGDAKTDYTFISKDKEDPSDLPRRPDPYGGLIKKLTEEQMAQALQSGSWGTGGEAEEATTPVERPKAKKVPF